MIMPYLPCPGNINPPCFVEDSRWHKTDGRLAAIIYLPGEFFITPGERRPYAQVHPKLRGTKNILLALTTNDTSTNGQQS